MNAINFTHFTFTRRLLGVSHLLSNLPRHLIAVKEHRASHHAAHPLPNHSQAWPLAGQLSLRWERACGYCTESPFPDFRSLNLHVLDKHAIPGWRTIVVKVEE